MVVPSPAPRSVIAWLFTVAAMIFAMAVIGAITRLTESGLSIMEWAPITGTLPPMSEAEWQRLFALYQEIPQYKVLNAGMTLAEFQNIFWWEWLHRLWGRLIGAVFALPFFWFLLRGRLPGWFKPHGWALLALGGLQGAVGWFMVASGFFDDRTAVSQYRLTIHLLLALALYGYALWMAFRMVWPAPPAAAGARGLRRGLKLLLALLAITIASGAFVAGLDAGLTYNTYPLMDGDLVPAGYGMLQPWIVNWFENIPAVQFNHRLLTFCTAALSLGLWAWSWRLPLSPGAARAIAATGLMVLLQFALGVATLLAAVPVVLGALHQAGAILLLTAVLTALYLVRHQGRSA